MSHFKLDLYEIKHILGTRLSKKIILLIVPDGCDWGKMTCGWTPTYPTALMPTMTDNELDKELTYIRQLHRNRWFSLVVVVAESMINKLDLPYDIRMEYNVEHEAFVVKDSTNIKPSLMNYFYEVDLVYPHGELK